MVNLMENLKTQNVNRQANASTLENQTPTSEFNTTVGKTNHKKEKICTIVCFAALFCFYLFVGLLCSYYSNGIQMGYLFGTDSTRIFKDWTDFFANHYRTKVHPLYVLLIYPIILLLRLMGCDAYFAVALFVATISTLNSLFLFKTLKKLNFKQTTFCTLLFTLFYALCFASIQNSLICESFVCGTFSLIVMTFWAVSLYNKNLTIRDEITIVPMCILAFSMLSTNIFIFVIFSLFIFVFKDKKTKKCYLHSFLRYCGWMILSLVACLALCGLQTLIFKTSENAIFYLVDIFKDILLGTKNTEEFNYTSSSPFTIKNIFNLFTTFWGFNICGGKLNTQNEQWTLSCTAFNYLFSIIIFAFFVYSIVCSIKKKNYFIIPVALAYLFEVALHLVYGWQEMMLYPINSLFLLVIIFYMGYCSSKFNNKKWFNISICSVFGLAIIQSLITATKIIYSTIKTFGFSGRMLLKNNWLFLVLMLLLAVANILILTFAKKSKINLN